MRMLRDSLSHLSLSLCRFFLLQTLMLLFPFIVLLFLSPFHWLSNPLDSGDVLCLCSPRSILWWWVMWMPLVFVCSFCVLTDTPLRPLRPCDRGGVFLFPYRVSLLVDFWWVICFLSPISLSLTPPGDSEVIQCCISLSIRFWSLWGLLVVVPSPDILLGSWLLLLPSGVFCF